MDAIRQRATSLVAFALLFSCFALGSVVRKPAENHVELAASILYKDHAEPPGGLPKLSETSSPVSIALDLVGLAGEMVSAAIAFGVATVVVTIITMLFCGCSRPVHMWAAIVNIAVPTLGLYFLVSSAIIAIRGADSFETYGDLARAMPSVLTIFPDVQITFVRVFLNTINPFSLWAAYLYWLMLREIGGTTPLIAGVGSALLVLGGSAAQGLIGVVATSSLSK